MKVLTIFTTLFLFAVVLSYADEVTIVTNKDSEVVNTMPSSNWGTHDYITDNWGGGVTARGIVEFDLTDEFDPSGYYVINSAIMSFNVLYNPPSDEPWGVYHNLESWEEMVVTWNNKPDIPDDADATTDYDGYGWQDFDVTDLVQQWVDGDLENYGVQLRAEDEPSNPYCYNISSDNSSYPDYWPELYIDYTDYTNIQSESFGKIKALFK